MQVQAFVACIAGVLGVWVALDFGFDGLAKGVALFGLSGRLIGITTMLMVLGAAIVMAWQAKSAWRVQWQYASFIAGLFFLSSLALGGHRSGTSRPVAAPRRCFSGFRGDDDVDMQFRAEKSHIEQKRLDRNRAADDAFVRRYDYFDAGPGAGQEWIWCQDKIGAPLVGVEIIAVAVIVARHAGHLPGFCGAGGLGSAAPEPQRPAGVRVHCRSACRVDRSAFAVDETRTVQFWIDSEIIGCT